MKPMTMPRRSWSRSLMISARLYSLPLHGPCTKNSECIWPSVCRACQGTVKCEMASGLPRLLLIIYQLY